MRARADEAQRSPDRGREIDARRVAADLASRGSAVVDGLLSREECRRLRSLYTEGARFRSTVVMARHGFGSGEYRYFAYPLPPRVQELRAALYRELAPIANQWAGELGEIVRYPATHEEFLAVCHDAGQRRPTPLLLRYGIGDYNCLHQDLYGEHVFPLQVVILLSEPATEFSGGELVLVEQRPRTQSRADVVPLSQGDGAVFAVRSRPVRGARGTYRVQLRHGVSRLLSGERITLGIIFHDAT